MTARPKRHGQRSYLVSGPTGAMVIRRMGSRNFLARHQKYDSLPWDLFGMRFNRLREAAEFARRECSA